MSELPTRETPVKYLRQVIEYLEEVLEAVVRSGEIAAEQGDQFDEITIGRSAYDHAATALLKLRKDGLGVHEG